MNYQNTVSISQPNPAKMLLIGTCLLLSSQSVSASGAGLSVVPYLGLSQLGDQTADFNASGIATGESDVSIDSGFTGGLSFRYDYASSRWSSEFGWEYRTNDASTRTSDGTVLPDGNYASNTFYLNGRYSLGTVGRFVPWVGGGLSLIQEIDIDSESSDSERSFEDSGSVGYQLMVGADYTISDRLYLTGELRYTSFTDLELKEEEADGTVTGLDYQPITVGIGIGFRF